jgi:hypothetical protein
MLHLFPNWIFRGIAVGLYLNLIIWIFGGLRQERWDVLSWRLSGGVLSAVLMTAAAVIWWMAL